MSGVADGHAAGIRMPGSESIQFDAEFDSGRVGMLRLV